MNSLSPECTSLKHEYDKCFNYWFREHYLKGDLTDICADIFKKYQACVKNAMKEQGMDFTEFEKSILGTSQEKQAPTNTSATNNNDEHT